MKNFYKKATNFGIEPNMSNIDELKVRILNVLCIVAICQVTILYACRDLIFGREYLALFHFLLVVNFIPPLILNKKKKHNLARYYLFILFPASLIPYNYFLADIGGENYLFSGVLFAFFLLESKRDAFIIGLYYALVFILIKVMLQNGWHLHYYSEFSQELFYFNVSISFLQTIFFSFVYSYQNTLQINKIESVNEILNNNNQELALQRDQIESQRLDLQIKNEEITDSINYAKRIQAAILPPNKIVKEYLQNSFILYKPKDVVAGDFYWMEHLEGKIFFAAADCTGHGVPGAMVSVVCNNALNRSVREYGMNTPGDILDKTKELVIEEFEKSEDEVKDGMDIALCCLEGNKLTYSGAHNPLWILRDDEIIEIKADKQPIGKFEFERPFTNHQVDLQKGDSIYIFSDGYPDQFGGDKGKKFKTINLKRLLISIQNQTMDKQRDILDDEFEKWRGTIEQIDDVCIIGVRI